MKQVIIAALLFISIGVFAQSAPPTDPPAPPKVYNLGFTEPEINFHYSNLEGIKLLLKKPGERTYTEVTQLVGAVDSLERNIIKYMKIQVDAEKAATEAKDKSKKK